MTYTLERLAPGSYDLWLNGEIVGSVVENASPSGYVRGWSAELLDDQPSAPRPAPFVEVEHSFSTLAALREWLGGAPISFDAHDN